MALMKSELSYRKTVKSAVMGEGNWQKYFSCNNPEVIYTLELCKTMLNSGLIEKRQKLCILLNGSGKTNER